MLIIISYKLVTSMAAWLESNPIAIAHDTMPSTEVDDMLDTDSPKRPSLLEQLNKLTGQSGSDSAEKYYLSWSDFLIWTTLDPSGTFALYWNALICMVAAYNLLLLPMRMAFPYFEERYREFWYLPDYLSDIYYLLDILVRMRTSFLVQGCLEYDWKLIARNYFRSSHFLVDALAVFPLDILLIENQRAIYQNYIIAVRINRLIKSNRIYAFIGRAESRSDFPNILRLGNLVLLLCSFIHLNSCFYFFISTSLAYNRTSDVWVYPGRAGTFPYEGRIIKIIVPTNSFSNQYLHSLHWSTQMLTTIAEVPTPTRSIEYLYSIALLILAVLMFATLVGNVGNILINLNAARTRFESRLDNVKQYMHNRNIKETLQENVLRWFDHLWDKNRGIDEQETLQNLPNKLRAQIAFCANKKVLTNNPIYKIGDRVGEGYKIDLVLKLRSELFPPKETIYRRGHIGNDMYILRSGKVRLTKRVNNQRELELEDGAWFGMNCVINFDEFGRERSETATTIGFCDILLLEKKDLIELLIDYPDAKEELSRQFQEMKTELHSIPNPGKKKKGVDIAVVTKDVNALISKFNSLKEQYGVLFEEHKKLKHAIDQLPSNSNLTSEA